jgi:hypothetical protein
LLGPDLFLAAASFVAGALNAAAGGGSFIAFPAVLATGVPPISANATNNTAMWLGSLASAREFRSQLDVPKATLRRMLAASALGSVAGALLLLRTPNATFAGLIPFLLLGATLLFIFGPRITEAARRSGTPLGVESPLGMAAQTAIAVYGGFFGAAIGILMLALLEVLGMHDLRRANAFKALLATVINGVAVVPFLIARVIAPEPALAMSLGAIAGGLLGARLVKRLPSPVVRGFVVTVACTMTAYFFWKTYLSAAPHV